MVKDSLDAPNLIADIGGTNARFALAFPDGRIGSECILSGADYPDLIQAAAAYLREVAGPRPRRAAVAVATPISGDWIQFTNSPWSFSTEAARQALGLEQLLIINDFTALALALPLLGPDERRQVSEGTAVEKAPIGLIGPGTGLGVSGLVWSGHHWIPLETEGGHVTFSACEVVTSPFPPVTSGNGRFTESFNGGSTTFRRNGCYPGRDWSICTRRWRNWKAGRRKTWCPPTSRIGR